MRKKIFFSVVMVLVLFFMVVDNSQAVQKDFETEVEVVFNATTNQLNIKTNNGTSENWFSRMVNSVGAIIPKAYVPTYKEELTVKNQLIDGVDTKECWALSFTSAIEAFNYARNTSDKGEVYSARHINQFSNNTFEGEKVTENRLNRNILTADGGNFYMATTYATNGYGPVLESDMPSNTAIQKIKYSALNTENGVKKHLEGYEQYISVYKYKDSSGEITYYNEFNYDGVATAGEELFSEPISNIRMVEFRTEVKTQIKNNGGILAYIFEADDSKDVNYDVLYYQGSNVIVKPSHAVLIVGWDDEYKADGWDNSGAYIALNSYGEDKYDNGFIYISYDDFYVEQTMVGITEMSDMDYENIYEYDELGSNTVFSLKNDSSELSAVNIFSRASSEDEKLTEVGVTSFSKQIVDVYYTENFDNSGKPKDFVLLEADKDVGIGYTTVRINKDITLTKDKFAVCVKFKSVDSDEKANIAIEADANITGADLFESVVANAGESYIVYTDSDASFDSSKEYYWQEMYFIDADNNKLYVNAGIKAVTATEEGETVEEKIKSSEYTVKNKMITRVPVNTTMTDFESKIVVNGAYTIVDKEDNIVTGDLVRTGYKVKVGNMTYEISVISDISGSGGNSYSRVLDLAKMRSHLISEKNSILTGVKLEAADINGNGNVDVIDLAKLRMLSVQ